MEARCDERPHVVLPAILRQWWRDRPARTGCAAHVVRAPSSRTSVVAVCMTRREECDWLMDLTGEALMRLTGRGAALTPAGKARLERLIALRGRVDQERARCGGGSDGEKDKEEARS